MLKKASLSMDTGDEEKAYVLYMRYLTIVQWIRKTPEYKKNTVSNVLATLSCFAILAYFCIVSYALFRTTMQR
jgi:hypothetical protein